MTKKKQTPHKTREAEMDHEDLMKVIRNGLTIAGHEMGPVGDHWPALNSIIAGCEKELHEIECDEAVLGELEFHLAEALRKMEDAIPTLAAKDRAEAKKLIKEYWEEYYAILEPVDAKFEPKLDDILDESERSFKSLRAAAHVLKEIEGRA